MKFRKYIACILVAVLAVSLSACFNVQIDLPTPAQPTAPTVPTEADIPTEAPVTDATLPTAAPETQPTAPVSSEPAPTAPTQPAVTEPAPTEAPKTPDQMDSAQLLTYFNDTLNRVKTDKVGFKKSKITNILDLQLSNSAANTLVGFVKGALLKETADETTVAKGQDGTDVFSPSGKPYVSTLTPSDITSINCEKSGGGYVITLGVKSETNPGATGSIMSRGFDFMTVDDVMNIYAPKVGATVARENVEVVFSDCTAKLTVDANGQVQNYQTYVKGVMNMKNASVKKVVTINTDLAITLASTTDYTDFQY